MFYDGNSFSVTRPRVLVKYFTSCLSSQNDARRRQILKLEASYRKWNKYDLRRQHEAAWIKTELSFGRDLIIVFKTGRQHTRRLGRISWSMKHARNRGDSGFWIQVWHVWNTASSSGPQKTAFDIRAICMSLESSASSPQEARTHTHTHTHTHTVIQTHTDTTNCHLYGQTPARCLTDLPHTWNDCVLPHPSAV